MGNKSSRESNQQKIARERKQREKEEIERQEKEQIKLFGMNNNDLLKYINNVENEPILDYDKELVGYDRDDESPLPAGLKKGDCIKKVKKGFCKIEANPNYRSYMNKFCQTSCIQSDKFNLAKEHRNMFDHPYQYILFQTNSKEYGFVDMKNLVDLLNNPGLSEPSYEFIFNGNMSLPTILSYGTEKGVSALSRFRKSLKFWGRYQNFCGIYSWSRDDNNTNKSKLTFKQVESKSSIIIYNGEGLDTNFYTPLSINLIVGYYKYDMMIDTIKEEYTRYKDRISGIDEKNKIYINKVNERKADLDLKDLTNTVKGKKKEEEEKEKKRRKEEVIAEKNRKKIEDDNFKENERRKKQDLRNIMNSNKRDIKNKNKIYTNLLKDYKKEEVKLKNLIKKKKAEYARLRLSNKKNSVSKNKNKRNQNKKKRKRQEALEKKEVEETLTIDEFNELQEFREKYENRYKELKNKKPLTEAETKEFNKLDKLIKLRDRRIVLLRKEFKKTITDKEREELQKLLAGRIKRRKRTLRKKRAAKFLQRELELEKKKLNGTITEKEEKELAMLIKRRKFRDRRRELIKKKLKGTITKQEEAELATMYERMKIWKNKKMKRKNFKRKLGRFANLNKKIYLNKTTNKRLYSGIGIIGLIIIIAIIVLIVQFVVNKYVEK